MKKINQKGFTAFELILLILVVAAVSFSGYMVWRNNQQKDQTNPSTMQGKNAVNDVSKDQRVPDGFSKKTIGDTGISLVYPISWGEVKQLDSSTGGGYELNGMRLSVPNDDSVMISRSFNAPSFCSYVPSTNTWTKAGEYPPNSCEPSVLKVSGVEAYGFAKGALGAYGYTYGIDLKEEKFLLIDDSIISNGSAEQDPDNFPSAADTNTLRTDLSKNVEIIIKNNEQLFEKR